MASFKRVEMLGDLNDNRVVQVVLEKMAKSFAEDSKPMMNSANKVGKNQVTGSIFTKKSLKKVLSSCIFSTLLLFHSR